MFNVVVSGGLSDCSRRQKQMCLSQIKLVPFFLSTQEGERHSKGWANSTRVHFHQLSPILPAACPLIVASGAKTSFFISYITENELTKTFIIRKTFNIDQHNIDLLLFSNGSIWYFSVLCHCKFNKFWVLVPGKMAFLIVLSFYRPNTVNNQLML